MSKVISIVENWIKKLNIVVNFGYSLSVACFITGLVDKNIRDIAIGYIVFIAAYIIDVDYNNCD